MDNMSSPEPGLANVYQLGESLPVEHDWTIPHTAVVTSDSLAIVLQPCSMSCPASPRRPSQANGFVLSSTAQAWLCRECAHPAEVHWFRSGEVEPHRCHYCPGKVCRATAPA